MVTVETEFLKQIDAYLREQVAPYAGVLDHDPRELESALRQMGDRNLLALRLSTRWGAPEVDPLTFWFFQEKVATYSGALAFLQTQHQSASQMLEYSDNKPLQKAYLPYLSSGQILVGIGYSHLRRTDPPSVRAKAVKGGFRVSGEVPWVTGYQCFREFILGAQLPDGQFVLGLVPLASVTQSMTSSIELSPPMQLAAMGSTQTVKARITDWFIPQDYVVAIQPADWLAQKDQRGALNHGFFAIGCARAGLNIMATVQRQRPEFVATAWKALDEEVRTCRQQMYAAQAGNSEPAQRVQLRAWAIELAVCCAQAAVAVARGSANYSYHPAQRVYREALAYTVFGQTTDVMAATLSRLAKRCKSS